MLTAKKFTGPVKKENSRVARKERIVTSYPQNNVFEVQQSLRKRKAKTTTSVGVKKSVRPQNNIFAVLQ